MPGQSPRMLSVNGIPASASSASVRWKICTGATRSSTVAWKS